MGIKEFDVSFVAERRQVLGGEQPGTIAGWRRGTPRTRYMDREIRLPVVSSGLQRRPWQCLAISVFMLLERRGCFLNTVYDNAHYRRASSHVHGAFLR